MARIRSHRRFLLGLILICVLSVLVTRWSSADPLADASTTTSHVVARDAARHGVQQATASPTPALADLQVTWWYDYWLGGWGCLDPSQPTILGLTVTNAGGTAAGPCVVQDGNVMWQVPSLEPGATFRWSEWGSYPRFPLVVDAYGQVTESNEVNNLVAPEVGPTWTITPRAPDAGATPSPPRRGAAVSGPMKPMTAPPICPSRTPVPTLIPSGRPPLPDLEVDSAVWDRLAVQMPDMEVLCIPMTEPWHFEVIIRNSGDAEAGWFSVAGGGAAWRVRGLGAGRSVTLRSEPRFLPGSITVDAFGWVEESREDNNTWSLSPGGTPTPKTRSLPICDATPTTAAAPGPTATASVTPIHTDVRVRGGVHERFSGLPLEGARVQFTFCGSSRTERTDSNGRYDFGMTFSWPAPSECRVANYVVRADGYVSERRDVLASVHMYESFALTRLEPAYLPVVVK